MPVVPFLFAAANNTVPMGLVILSAGLSGLALFGVGAALALFTGRSPFLSGGRQLALGAAAAALTFAIGSVIGVSTGG